METIYHPNKPVILKSSNDLHDYMENLLRCHCGAAAVGVLPGPAKNSLHCKCPKGHEYLVVITDEVN